MDLTTLTDDEVVAKQQELGAQIDALRAERLLYADEMRRRTSATSQALAAIASMSPEALAELKRLLPGAGIAIAEPLPEASVSPPTS